MSEGVLRVYCPFEWTQSVYSRLFRWCSGQLIRSAIVGNDQQELWVAVPFPTDAFLDELDEFSRQTRGRISWRWSPFS
jgi:hypothetical protein